FVEDSDFLIVQGPPEDVWCRVDVRVHEPGNWAYRRWRGWKHSNLRQHLARVHHRCKPSAPDNCNPSFEEGAARCRSTHVAVVRAADMDSAACPRPTTTIGEFPSWEIRPAHRSPS